jgi:hypothetical protein
MFFVIVIAIGILMKGPLVCAKFYFMMQLLKS